LLIRPCFLYRFSSFKRSNYFLKGSIFFLKASDFLLYKKALYTRLITCLRHCSPRVVRFLAVYLEKKCLRTALIIVLLFIVLSVIKYLIRDYCSGAALGASTFFKCSPWREVSIRVIDGSQ
jgi:hypothetical protein